MKDHQLLKLVQSQGTFKHSAQSAILAKSSYQVRMSSLDRILKALQNNSRYANENSLGSNPTSTLLMKGAQHSLENDYNVPACYSVKNQENSLAQVNANQLTIKNLKRTSTAQCRNNEQANKNVIATSSSQSKRGNMLSSSSQKGRSQPLRDNLFQSTVVGSYLEKQGRGSKQAEKHFQSVYLKKLNVQTFNQNKRKIKDILVQTYQDQQPFEAKQEKSHKQSLKMIQKAGSLPVVSEIPDENKHDVTNHKVEQPKDSQQIDSEKIQKKPSLKSLKATTQLAQQFASSTSTTSSQNFEYQGLSHQQSVKNAKEIHKIFSKPRIYGKVLAQQAEAENLASRASNQEKFKIGRATEQKITKNLQNQYAEACEDQKQMARKFISVPSTSAAKTRSISTVKPPNPRYSKAKRNIFRNQRLEEDMELFQFEHETIQKEEVYLLLIMQRDQKGMESLNVSEIQKELQTEVKSQSELKRNGTANGGIKSPSCLIGPYDQFPFLEENGASVNPHQKGSLKNLNIEDLQLRAVIRMIENRFDYQ